MKDIFGCSQSGSIKRNGKNQKGYPKMKLRQPLDQDP